MKRFFEVLLNIITFGLLNISIEKEIVTVPVHLKKPEEYDDLDKKLVRFLTEVVKLPYGCTAIDDMYNRSFSELLDLMNQQMEEDEVFSSEILDKFYEHFVKCGMVLSRKIETTDQVKFINNWFIELQGFVLSLLQQENRQFFRTYKQIDLCLQQLISKDEFYVLVFIFNTNNKICFVDQMK